MQNDTTVHATVPVWTAAVVARACCGVYIRTVAVGAWIALAGRNDCVTVDASVAARTLTTVFKRIGHWDTQASRCAFAVGAWVIVYLAVSSAVQRWTLAKVGAGVVHETGSTIDTRHTGADVDKLFAVGASVAGQTETGEAVIVALKRRSIH